MGKRAGRTPRAVTEADDFMGPAITTFCRGRCHRQRRSERSPAEGRCEAVVGEAGHVDVLMANLSIPNPKRWRTRRRNEQWAAVFDKIVHPLHRLVRAVLPQMIERGAARSSWSAAPAASAWHAEPLLLCGGAWRPARLCPLRRGGGARHNVQVNATRADLRGEPHLFPPDYIDSPELRSGSRRFQRAACPPSVRRPALLLFLRRARERLLRRPDLPLCRRVDRLMRHPLIDGELKEEGCGGNDFPRHPLGTLKVERARREAPSRRGRWDAWRCRLPCLFLQYLGDDAFG
jgi:2-keto-3-deoxy-L-fuconate dehydrogenase